MIENALMNKNEKIEKKNTHILTQDYGDEEEEMEYSEDEGNYQSNHH